MPHPRRSTLFPYTTLFRSDRHSVMRRGMTLVRRASEVSDLREGALFKEKHVRGLQILIDRKSTRLNSSHEWISYAVFCLKKKKPPPLDRGPSSRRDGVGLR